MNQTVPTFQVLVDHYYSIDIAYRWGGHWEMGPDCWAAIKSLAEDNVYIDPDDNEFAPGRMLLGDPVRVAEGATLRFVSGAHVVPTRYFPVVDA